ncbi:MAG: MOSC domain-containing protein [Bdellovibrionaceae bacterium]|nr:MOSC domain-containing protein [Pseudobdellovibrionaceae bacterium]
MNTELEVVSLHIYPVKSCGRVDLREMSIGPRGPQHDREWMWVDSTRRFITQRQHPEMALISTALEPDALILSKTGHAPLRISLTSGPRPTVAVNVWHDTCQAYDEGDETHLWIKSALGMDARLVRIAQDFERKLPEKYNRPESHTGFADTLPFLLTTEDSLAELNSRLAAPVQMTRFRPNIVVRGGGPYDEDRWSLIRLGTIEFDVARDCSRCNIITVDPATAVAGKEPLRTLATYRRDGTRINFGRNMIHLNQGRLNIGDRGTVMQLKPALADRR